MNSLKRIFSSEKEEDLELVSTDSDFEKYILITPVVGAFLSYKPEHIADQLTLKDWKLFKAITEEEQRLVYERSMRITTNVSKLLEGHVVVKTWVRDVILKSKNAELRRTVLENFIRMAYRLHKLRNVHSAEAVIVGLHTPPILRLKRTWKKVSPVSKKRFKKLYKVYLDEDKIDDMMWVAWNSYGPRCIPSINVLFNEVKSLNEDSFAFDVCFVQYLQSSKYDHLTEFQGLQDYLNSLHYTMLDAKRIEVNGLRMSLNLESVPA